MVAVWVTSQCLVVHLSVLNSGCIFPPYQLCLLNVLAEVHAIHTQLTSITCFMTIACL